MWGYLSSKDCLKPSFMCCATHPPWVLMASQKNTSGEGEERKRKPKSLAYPLKEISARDEDGRNSKRGGNGTGPHDRAEHDAILHHPDAAVLSHHGGFPD